MEENKRQMENTIESTEKALVEGNAYAIPDSLLTFNLEFRDLECNKLLGKIVSKNCCIFVLLTLKYIFNFYRLKIKILLKI